MYKPKSWREKLLDNKDLPKVVEINSKLSKRWGEGTCVIPAPIEVDALMKKIPKGKLTTINHLRETLAKKHEATIGCPITTGIFAWLSANVAVEEFAAGKKKITPYWRTLKTGGEINPKYPGGYENQIKLLESEGHSIVRKGKKFFVEDFESHLSKLK
jgi:hypothetical protein